MAFTAISFRCEAEPVASMKCPRDTDFWSPASGATRLLHSRIMTSAPPRATMPADRPQLLFRRFAK